jgi:hypothetical protein
MGIGNDMQFEAHVIMKPNLDLSRIFLAKLLIAKYFTAQTSVCFSILILRVSMNNFMLLLYSGWS